MPQPGRRSYEEVNGPVPRVAFFDENGLAQQVREEPDEPLRGSLLDPGSLRELAEGLAERDREAAAEAARAALDREAAAAREREAREREAWERENLASLQAMAAWAAAAEEKAAEP